MSDLEAGGADARGPIRVDLLELLNRHRAEMGRAAFDLTRRVEQGDEDTSVIIAAGLAEAWAAGVKVAAVEVVAELQLRGHAVELDLDKFELPDPDENEDE